MATKQVVVGGASVTGPQWKELVRQVVDGELSAAEVQAILERRNPFEVAYFTIVDDGSKKTSELLDECRRHFRVYCWLSNEELDKQFPAPAQPTSRRFKKVTEADEENKNLSADDLIMAGGVAGITLRERIIMEQVYFKETGQHLDVQNITLCSGSRYSYGYVPRAFWYPDSRKFYISRALPGYRSGRLRSRSAVSL